MRDSIADSSKVLKMHPNIRYIYIYIVNRNVYNMCLKNSDRCIIISL